jgi:hypothetical protein
MSCECVERFRAMADSRRAEARKVLERDLPARLEAFAGAMSLGAVQLVARRLLRAGVFRASLDLGGSREVSRESALAAVGRAVAAEPRQRLREFVRRYGQVLAEQLAYVDPENVLPHRFRNRERVMEALGGFLDAELDAAERYLGQLEDLERRLPVWQSFARGGDVPRVEPVMDFHDSRK